MTILSHILGFPRIGINRELKTALENYWNGKCNKENVLKVGKSIRINNWQQQKQAGIDLITVGDFAWYDHVLNTSLMLNNIPHRHIDYKSNTINLDTMFRVARGYSMQGKTVLASDMKKWFNTNYHYIVPEFYYGQNFKLAWTQLLNEIDEALSLGYKIKPILLGPLTYLWLGKTKNINFDKLFLLPSLISVYNIILDELHKRNIDWVQIDEPILVLELPNQWKDAYLNVYNKLNNRVQILLTTYFDDIKHNIDIIKNIPVQGIHIDCVSNHIDLYEIHNKLPSNWILSVGIINGRNIWRSDLKYWFDILSNIVKQRKIWISTSCSLLHVPIDLSKETKLNKKESNLFAFAIQKCFELSILCKALNNINKEKYKLNIENYSKLSFSKKYFDNKVKSKLKNNLDLIHKIHDSRQDNYKNRIKYQKERFNLPIFPTTTIGSFPQTNEIRKLRKSFKSGNLDQDNYTVKIKKYIKKIIIEQENIGLDVLVHGEPERNDMVEYFGENLDGFLFTQNGWVQSYGSRCVKPPIIIQDISRSKQITVQWTKYAQSLTKKPVKGILTGPVTILCWSFPREDISRKDIVWQLALAIREEVIDLENAGIGIIQIDEPALREGLPLKHSAWKQYLAWATKAFRIISSAVKNETQIHTHMCYSEFDDIINAIVKLDADVITIEASRSNMECLKMLKHINYPNSIGPGIYDVHSPNVPSVNNMLTLLNKISNYIKIKNLWVNPDCGLKTRSWKEIKQSLINMVSAAKEMRNKYSTNQK